MAAADGSARGWKRPFDDPILLPRASLIRLHGASAFDLRTIIGFDHEGQKANEYNPNPNRQSCVPK
jgi:hypothetical protein